MDLVDHLVAVALLQAIILPILLHIPELGFLFHFFKLVQMRLQQVGLVNLIVVKQALYLASLIVKVMLYRKVRHLLSLQLLVWHQF